MFVSLHHYRDDGNKCGPRYLVWLICEWRSCAYVYVYCMSIHQSLHSLRSLLLGGWSVLKRPLHKWLPSVINWGDEYCPTTLFLVRAFGLLLCFGDSVLWLFPVIYSAWYQAGDLSKMVSSGSVGRNSLVSEPCSLLKACHEKKHRLERKARIQYPLLKEAGYDLFLTESSITIAKKKWHFVLRIVGAMRHNSHVTKRYSQRKIFPYWMKYLGKNRTNRICLVFPTIDTTNWIIPC